MNLLNKIKIFKLNGRLSKKTKYLLDKFNSLEKHQKNENIIYVDKNNDTIFQVFGNVSWCRKKSFWLDIQNECKIEKDSVKETLKFLLEDSLKFKLINLVLSSKES